MPRLSRREVGAAASGSPAAAVNRSSPDKFYELAAAAAAPTKATIPSPSAYVFPVSRRAGRVRAEFIFIFGR